MAGNGTPSGPDLTNGIPASDLDDGGLIAGRVGDEAVLLARRGDEVFAIGATCTHYGGPLAEGRMVGDTVRCPWHHACFSLRTGEALGAPALDHVAAWTVERRDGKLYVREKRSGAIPSRTPARKPSSVVILGNGAAGQAAAEMLRREGYDGPVTLIEADPDEPADRPNLSKDYLAGKAQPEWIALRDGAFFEQHDLTRVQGRADAVDPEGRTVTLAEGSEYSYDALLIATGAEPRPLPVPIASSAPVFYLRTVADSDGIIGAARSGARAIVIGASFIGLEVAASLRARDVDVVVVAPESIPLARVMGDDLGKWVRKIHEEHGVEFRLGATVRQITAEALELEDGTTLEADFYVAGVGVRPRDAIAKAAGLDVDDGIIVNAKLEASAPGVWAAGDVARYPYHVTGEPVRIEHWVHAQRMGQHAARNILGADRPFRDVPFFWSHHYDGIIAYVGQAAGYDAAALDGSPDDMDCAVRFTRDDATLALATIFRDGASLAFEAELEGRS